MKRLVVLTAVAAAATSAHAFDYKINLEGRADVQSVTNTESVNTGAYDATDKYTNFAGGVFRLNTQGNFNDSLSYRFRYRFSTGAGAPAGALPTAAPTVAQREAQLPSTATIPNNGIDYAYIDHKNSMFTTRWGKFADPSWGGRETIWAASDVIVTSAAVANFRSAIGSEYRYGVSGRFTMGENVLAVTVSNPNAAFTDSHLASATDATRTNTGIAIGAYYTGSFMNKMVQPVISYTTLAQDQDTGNPTPGAGTVKGNDTMWNAGLKSEVGGAVIELEYKEWKIDNFSGLTAAGTVTDNSNKTQSWFANVMYPMGEFTPMAYYVNDKYTDKGNTTSLSNAATNTAKDFKRTTFAVGALWKPFADANFRYHAYYSNAKTTYDSASAVYSKLTSSQVVVGIKFDI